MFPGQFALSFARGEGVSIDKSLISARQERLNQKAKRSHTGNPDFSNHFRTENLLPVEIKTLT
jgi:hypothetical protein